MHGIPILIESDIPGGVETLFFPSGRRCPELFDCLHAMADAQGEAAVAAAIRRFLSVGLLAVGYTPAEVERYLRLVPADRLGAFIAAAQLGGTRQQLFRDRQPGPAELACFAARYRLLRTIAILHHLDPETVLPEDLLLLQRNASGSLHIQQEYRRCTRWLATSRHP